MPAPAGWHSQARFCSLCGHPTAPRSGSLAQTCTNPDCGAQHFPRVNPAMIVLVHHADGHGERCLLGRQPGWKPRVYSALSGYVEPGESAEDAVLREVMEETGIRVCDVRYHSSQPWPFSDSLMLGFHARATNTDIRDETNSRTPAGSGATKSPACWIRESWPCPRPKPSPATSSTPGTQAATRD
jgi:NAD+ diphosphatase